MQFDDVVMGRRSIRGYKNEPVSKALIHEVLALAMRSPSSMNSIRATLLLFKKESLFKDFY